MLKNFMQPGSTSAPGTSRTDSARTPSTSAKPAETASPVSVPAEVPPVSNDQGSKLTVGPNIKLKGSEITDCEILVVEGRVEASMNSRDIRIAEGGVFAGKAEIDVAEVRGTFEGELTARKQLVIYATGKVTGTIRYGTMRIEEGGTISGEVQRIPAGASIAKVADHTSSTTPETTEIQAAEWDQVKTGAAYLRNQAGRR